jgi:hypothetical protein
MSWKRESRQRDDQDQKKEISNIAREASYGTRTP